MAGFIGMRANILNPVEKNNRNHRTKMWVHGTTQDCGIRIWSTNVKVFQSYLTRETGSSSRAIFFFS